MASTINALTSGGGLAVSGDTSGSLQLQTNNGTTAMTIDTSQNVGIGTSSPSTKLEIIGNYKQKYAVGNSQGFTISLNSSDDVILSNYYNAAMRFETNNTERMRIDSSGNLLVGITSSDAAGGVTIRPSATAPYVYSKGSSTSNSDITSMVYSTGASAYRFYVGFGGTVYATSTSISAISDQSLKENIVDIEPSLDKVMALKPRRFDWKSEVQIEQKQIQGFIAQEVEQVLPDLVYDYQYSENEIKKSIKMGDMIPTLVKAIQEQQAIITDLKARIETLEGAKA